MQYPLATSLLTSSLFSQDQLTPKKGGEDQRLQIGTGRAALTPTHPSGSRVSGKQFWLDETARCVGRPSVQRWLTNIGPLSVRKDRAVSWVSR